ncbi:hypothetical protein [Synechococcus sp. CC9605]|uniref:hypothetical protein n=1 Tax=Synechococcus sp. (strain CC9605) TaxID=110662 RepID=UPI00059DE4BD|nr:hypothetical protein [Synechococcus sp. CC9605]
MKGIPAMTLAPPAAADQLRRPLLVMAHPRHGRDSSGDGSDAKPRSITTKASSRLRRDDHY